MNLLIKLYILLFIYKIEQQTSKIEGFVTNESLQQIEICCTVNLISQQLVEVLVD